MAMSTVTYSTLMYIPEGSRRNYTQVTLKVGDNDVGARIAVLPPPPPPSSPAVADGWPRPVSASNLTTVSLH
ncbi:hypothetical protein KIN20_016850 [Parelaphostrongylus tenuis]|uniref:Uncharacterized protein n=1 Tax=Parelaphostrongylus tenuis TaxID=148309 RepID=A0AAD5N1U3_PARTN|nr:hypothetical protein KIN20_016850 [Parelaphostrongylus tenuis]